MPWKTSGSVDQRLQFIAAVEAEPDEPFSVLCARFGISRKTGYKWRDRYNEGGPARLLDRGSRPRRSANATPDDLVARLLTLRKEHPLWGPKKLGAVLRAQDPTQPWPAASTLGDLLKRHGLITPRRRRVRWPRESLERPAPEAPNDTWCVDFKGDFLLGDRSRCYPLTVTDLHSRYLLCIEAFSSIDTLAVIACFLRLFAQYGLPTRIRSDNGVPFATQALGGLSPLSILWLKLGIIHERIDPGHPEQNGAHERMHRTLKAEATRPPEQVLSSQQLRLDRFRCEFNELRPHEALGQTTPHTHYWPSERALPAVLVDPVYKEGTRKLRVSNAGKVVLRGKNLYLHRMLGAQQVGLEALGEERWSVYFGPRLLGDVDLSLSKPRIAPVC